MATRKVTITLPAELIDTIKEAVEEGTAESVSGYITDAVRRQIDRDPLDHLIADMIAETGEPGPEHFAAVDEFLAAGRGAATGHAA